jgi:predicted phosphate transport protein (TIGR00153 family)
MAALFSDFSANFNDFEEYAKKAKEIEHDADRKVHAIVDAINKTFITPFDREDIYMLATNLDDIVDRIESVIKTAYLYNIKKEIPVLKKFTSLIIDGADTIERMMTCLEKMKYSQELRKTKEHMHHLEDRGDELFASAIKNLFSDHHDSIEVIKVKEIIEKLERIMDKYQRVGDIIEGIIVKST